MTDQKRIEPTVPHARDLGYIPVVIADAWVLATRRRPAAPADIRAPSVSDRSREGRSPDAAVRGGAAHDCATPAPAIQRCDIRRRDGSLRRGLDLLPSPRPSNRHYRGEL